MVTFIRTSLAMTFLGGLLLLAGVAAFGQATFTNIHNFASSEGAAPYDAFIIGSDGNFYGAASSNGAHGSGAIIKATLSGAVTTLYSFSTATVQGPLLINSDGDLPWGALVEGSDGDFYGTCYVGGANGTGTIFKVTPSGTLTVLHTFSALDSSNHNADGARPVAGLAIGADGNFYGITTAGGTNGFGAFYKITSGGQFTTLHSLLGTEGVEASGIITGSDGNFYVTCPNGGANVTLGSVLQITPAGAVTVLHSFAGAPSDASGPENALIEGSDGNFYDTSVSGGVNNKGTVFKITPGGTVTILHAFNGTDGYWPNSSLVQATDGNFYGTVEYGGTSGNGTLFKITPGGTFTLLYNFSAFASGQKNSDGAYPFAGMVEGSDYNLYGTTSAGGQNGLGTLFQLNVHLIPPPTLSGLHPGSVNAAGPAFTLIVKGAAFLDTSSVNWIEGASTTPLSTTFVSATQLKAAVPASLIASPKKVQISVTTPSAGTSNLKPFKVKLTTLKLTGVQLSRDSTTGDISATLSIKNVGYLSAANASLTKSTLGPKLSPVATTTSLPISLGSIAAGATVTVTLTYPGSAGTSGEVAYLKANTRFTGGASGLSFKVTLP
ncbi:MAG TPA: choice-of-anchor tandem repeat GloVer-containing protein [Chthonomonadaceae bacterium]|nr:choice-of-anchor tandem repeat GloVer-containing protein [Chthonomonadaceae bacterium]